MRTAGCSAKNSATALTSVSASRARSARSSSFFSRGKCSTRCPVSTRPPSSASSCAADAFQWSFSACKDIHTAAPPATASAIIPRRRGRGGPRRRRVGGDPAGRTEEGAPHPVERDDPEGKARGQERDRGRGRGRGGRRLVPQAPPPPPRPPAERARRKGHQLAQLVSQ